MAHLALPAARLGEDARDVGAGEGRGGAGGRVDEGAGALDAHALARGEPAERDQRRVLVAHGGGHRHPQT
ncbi:hypothetical protein ACWGM4_11695 [Streptomyces albidoflavus]